MKKFLGSALLIGSAWLFSACGPQNDESPPRGDQLANAETQLERGTDQEPPNDAQGTEPDPQPDPPGDSPQVDPKEEEPVVPSGGRAINLNSDNSGTTVSAGVGDLVIIELKANMTTGFSWEADPEADDALLVLKSNEYRTFSQLNPEVQPLVGQSGMATFTYQVVDTGTAEISLVYRQPWEKEVEPAKTFHVTIEATETTSPVVTGKIVFGEAPDLERISRIEVSIRNTALADGPAPLVGTVELKPPFQLPIAFAVPYDPATVQPNPMFYSISARVLTVIDGEEKLYYINDTHHGVFSDADDTKRDIAVKKLR